MENCSFSSIDDCHQTKFVKVATLRSVRKDSEDLELLHLRTKIPKRNITNICGHHERMLLTKYSDLQTRCCDPFNKHQKPQTKGLKIISLSKYKDLSCAPALGLTPGEKLCPACKIALEKHKETQNTDAPGPAVASHSSSEDESSGPIETASSPEKEASVVEVNTALAGLDETPVKLHQLPSSSKRVKMKKKFVSALCSLRKS